MKDLFQYICEASSHISEKKFFELAQLRSDYNNTEGSRFTPHRTMNRKSLQFYNKKWIYGYSVYYDGKANNIQFPIIGVYTHEEYDEEEMMYKVKDTKAFIMNNEQDVIKFGEHCMAQDNSIFTVNLTSEKIKTKTTDYAAIEKEMYTAVDKDHTIIDCQVSYKHDYYTLLRYKK